MFVRAAAAQNDASMMPPWLRSQVGIVRQTETAAIKKAEGSRGTFDRKLNAVYTSATLEASVHQCMLSILHIAMCAASVPCPPAAGALPLFYPDVRLRGLGLWRLYGISSNFPLTRACVAKRRRDTSWKWASWAVSVASGSGRLQD